MTDVIGTMFYVLTEQSKVMIAKMQKKNYGTHKWHLLNPLARLAHTKKLSSFQVDFLVMQLRCDSVAHRCVTSEIFNSLFVSLWKVLYV